MRPSRTILLLAALIAIGVACDSPSQPSPQPLRDVVLTGPQEIAPGESARFTVTARYGDGSTEDVTSQSTWQTAKPAVLRVTSDGSAQGISRGESGITARFRGVSRSKAVLVLERGTYRLAGRIAEAGGNIAGARVAVLSGTGTGLTATSEDNGFYALYGVAGAIRLHISAGGFEEMFQDLTVTSHTQQNYDLKLLVPPVDIAGSWRLTLSAAPECDSRLPEDTRRREFSLAIVQNGTHFTATPSSPTLYRKYGIEGRIYGDVFSMTLWYDDYYGDYSLLDHVSQTDWVGIRGTIQGTGTTSSIQGAFSGSFDYYQTAANAMFPARMTATCAADPSYVFRRD
jgi:hypothetical protein